MHLFLFNDTATTEIYTLSLHDALPISARFCLRVEGNENAPSPNSQGAFSDRKSTRLNSSHPSISYAVFCLKKKSEALYHSLKFRLRIERNKRCRGTLHTFLSSL